VTEKGRGGAEVYFFYVSRGGEDREEKESIFAEEATLLMRILILVPGGDVTRFQMQTAKHKPEAASSKEQVGA